MKILKKVVLLFVFVWLILSCSVKNDKALVKAKQVAKDFKANYIKDSREELFKVNLILQNGKILTKGVVEDLSKKAKLLERLQEAQIKVIDNIRVLPDSVVGEQQWGLINLSSANLRATPRHSAELVTQAILGTPVKVFDVKDSWYLIQTPDKYIAWVDGAGIFTITANELTNWQKSSRIIVVDDKNPIVDEQNNVVSDVTLGSILQVINQNSNLYHVKLPDGRTGYINKADAVNFKKWKEEVVLLEDGIEKVAKKMMGKPYLWGGTSTKAMDCSGFSKTVYFINGTILARDASLQFLQGDTISPAQGYQALSKGDLVFFGSKNSQTHQPKVTHVGIYLGNGEFIHAAGRVKINSFNPDAENYSNFRTITWLGGRRFINSKFDAKKISIAHHSWY